MKTNWTQILAVLTASSLSLSIAAQAAPKGQTQTSNQEPTSKPQPTPKKEPTPKKRQSNRTEPKRIDLGSKLQKMQLHDGLNLVHSGDGVKLMAQARNNKVIGWSATDEKGNKVPVKTQTGGGTGGGTAGKITVTISYNEKYGTINNIVIIDSEKEPEL